MFTSFVRSKSVNIKRNIVGKLTYIFVIDLFTLIRVTTKG